MYSPIYRYVPGGVPNNYSSLGRMSFAGVGNTDMYFGDWADVQPGAAAGTAGTNYPVFYNDTGKTAKMSTGGTAVYSVRGVSHYVDTDTTLLTGDLKADFTKKRLNGTIRHPGLSVTVDDAVINTVNTSFGGRATANDVSGTTHDNFYGNGAATLAGVAEFAQSPNLSTVFGDTRK